MSGAALRVVRLLLGKLTSLSLVKLVFCTQEGRENEHKGVLFFDVSHTHITRTRTHKPHGRRHERGGSMTKGRSREREHDRTTHLQLGEQTVHGLRRVRIAHGSYVASRALGR